MKITPETLLLGAAAVFAATQMTRRSNPAVAQAGPQQQVGVDPRVELVERFVGQVGRRAGRVLNDMVDARARQFEMDFRQQLGVAQGYRPDVYDDGDVIDVTFEDED